MVGGIWLAAFSGGAAAGKAFSFAFEEPEVTRVYVARAATYEGNKRVVAPSIGVGKTPIGLGAISRLPTPAGGKWHFECGSDQYDFDVTSSKLDVSKIEGAYQNKELERKGIAPSEIVALGQVMGVTAVGTVPEFVTAIQRLRAESWVAAAIAGGLVGFGWGFMLTYTEAPTCEQVKSAVGKDKEDFWKSLKPPTTRPIWLGKPS